MLSDTYPEDAACAGLWWKFELLESDHWLVDGLNFPELWHFNEENFREADKLCSACPVRQACHTRTKFADIEWNKRAGFGPTRTLHWTGRSKPNVKAPQCQHNPDGTEETCGLCIYSAKKVVAERLDLRTRDM